MTRSRATDTVEPLEDPEKYIKTARKAKRTMSNIGESSSNASEHQTSPNHNLENQPPPTQPSQTSPINSTPFTTTQSPQQPSSSQPRMQSQDFTQVPPTSIPFIPPLFTSIPQPTTPIRGPAHTPPNSQPWGTPLPNYFQPFEPHHPRPRAVVRNQQLPPRFQHLHENNGRFGFGNEEIEDNEGWLFNANVNEGTQGNNHGVGNGRRMSILDHVSQRREGTGSSIYLPPVPANTSLVLNAHIMANLKDNTFCGSDLEDAQEHLDAIEEIMEGYKVAGVTQDQIMLRVFPRTLTGKAKRWLKLLPPNSIRSWAALKEKFIAEFNTPAMINLKLSKINNFTQEGGESLNQAWIRFQELLRACPQHDMTQWRILARFYDALDISTRQNLDNGGPFLHLSEDEALQRLDVLAKYSHQYHEGKTKKDVGSISNDDKDGEIRALKAKLEGTDRKIEKLTTSLHAMRVGCNHCGGSHLPKDCTKNQAKTVTFEDDEEVMMGSADEWEMRRENRKYQGGGGFYKRYDQPFSGNRNYDRGQQQSNRNYNNHNSNQDQVPNQQGQQQQTPDSFGKLEMLINKYITHSSKRQEDTDVMLRNHQASIHNIEKQVGQIAQTLQERIPGSLPGFTTTNPNAQGSTNGAT